jgi:molybdopterin synthase catalytic subunit
MNDRIEILLTSEALSLDSCRDFVTGDGAGAIVLFIGTVRNKSNNKEVTRLEFESYESMAVSEMQKIAEQVLGKFPIHKVAIHHRTGVLDIGDVPVIIAVSSAHRKEAYDASQFCIDTLKQTVPIWKKEVFIGGEEWVSATP